MNKVYKILFSMETMGFLILVFAASVGTATFIENDFGIPGSKSVVYNATWFNILLFWLAINLVVNIFRYKMYRKQKLAIFLFHVSFLVILLGSAITRFISYEGTMHIREGGVSNTIVSDATFVSATLTDGQETVASDKEVLLSALRPNAYSASEKIGNKKFKFKTAKYIPNAQEAIVELSEGGKPYMVLVASFGMGRQTHYFEYGTSKILGMKSLNFSDSFVQDAINIKTEDGKLMINTTDTITTLSMMGGVSDTLLPGNWHPFEQRNLYQLDKTGLVLTNFYQSGGIDYVTSNRNDMSLMDALLVEVTSGSETKTVALRGGKGYKGEPYQFTLNGVDLNMSYGAKEILLPFQLKLIDFDLERYPGSKSPASYASDVVLIDKQKNLNQPHRIFMNNVLNYGGYRFFQSSYDKDELGTILSVNHDYWGTFFTYIGYLIMTLGMFLTPFTKSSRFALLGRKLKKGAAKTKNATSIILIGLMLSGFAVMAQDDHNHNHDHNTVDPLTAIHLEEAQLFGDLLVQSHDGRIKPMNTFSSEMLRKISRKNSLFDLNPDQIILGMLSHPAAWQEIPMIKVSDEQLKRTLGIDGKLASYIDFINVNQGTYKLQDYVSAAYAKKPSQRNMFDKDVMKVDERLNICFLIYTGDLLKLLPDPNDPYKAWYTPGTNAVGLEMEDSIFIADVVPTYLNAIAQHDHQLADELVRGILTYQKRYGAEIIPSDRKISMEISYNKMMIFNQLSKLYGLLGFIMLILIFVEIFRQSKAIKYIIRGLMILIIIGFVMQTGGLIIRWYISGHAPWSNGYESLIYIGWVTMLAGIIFSRRSSMTLAATTVLTSIILMVAHLSWMDPEITNLVPVLKSYWLTIHVSIITASYGFLALGMLLGFLNLILMILKTKGNHEGLEEKITDLTAINERTLMIGLYMLTVGTFLGGVWANESWGRYWGWDPKETWALVSVLIYSFILHMHYIPGLKNNYSFNFASLVGYFSILMTYFGVNYYLSGLHSYAAGDPVPVPTFVYYTVAIIAAVALWAYINNRRFVKSKVK